MSYEQFKEWILMELREHYGEDAVITVETLPKKNSEHPDGICVRKKNNAGRTAPAIYLEGLYWSYQKGAELEACMRTIYERIEDKGHLKKMEELAEKMMDWEYVREHIYPVLLSTDENQELLKSLVSISMLDLSIVYTIRLNLKEWGNTDTKINEVLLSHYGISREELHNQAVHNMEQDGYRFQSIEEVLKEMCPFEAWEEEKEKGGNKPPMYVLTNRAKIYGAAGILNRKLLREFAGGRSFYILPSSLHETIFIPAELESNSEALDYMVADINQTTVLKEDRLSDHSYYYDGEAGDIRMSA